MGRRKEWIDIDLDWLRGYLTRAGWRDLFDDHEWYGDLLGDAVQRRLPDEDWRKLRGAWQRRQHRHEAKGRQELEAGSRAATDAARDYSLEHLRLRRQQHRLATTRRRIATASDWAAFAKATRLNGYELAVIREHYATPGAWLRSSYLRLQSDDLKATIRKAEAAQAHADEVAQVAHIFEVYRGMDGDWDRTLEGALEHLPSLTRKHSRKVLEEAWNG